MLVAGVMVAGIVAAALSSPSSGFVLALVAVIGAFVAWRQHPGQFYKELAQERAEENQQLREQNEKLRKATDITPINDTLEGVVRSLERHSKITEQVFEKVQDMNGALRAHGAAMQALADRLILDEAARGLLAAAARKDPL